LSPKGVRSIGELKFMVDHNVGKLAKWLRMMGYDTLFFDGPDDADMIAAALTERRVVLTKDAQLIKRRVVTSGRLRVVCIKGDRPELQIKQVVRDLSLDHEFKPFTICLECNEPLMPRTREGVKDRVPPYVFKTQSEYVECLKCHRIYWKGTHWQGMVKRLEEIVES
jgi:uncharacterized protein with PIN domain